MRIPRFIGEGGECIKGRDERGQAGRVGLGERDRPPSLKDPALFWAGEVVGLAEI